MNQASIPHSRSLLLTYCALLLALGSLFPIHVQAVCVSPPANMRAWFPFDETGGPIATNLLGQNGTYAVSNGAIQGKVAGAVTMFGTYVTVPDHAALDLGTGDFTIDAWVEVINSSQLHSIVDKRSHSSGIGYTLFLQNNRPGFQMADSIGTFSNFSSTVRIDDGQWHLIAVTVDRNSSSGGKIYVDGSVVKTFNPTAKQGSLSNSEALWLGRHHPVPSTAEFNTSGFSVDELEIFNRALSASEIQSLYHAGSAGKCKPLAPPTSVTTTDGDICQSASSTFTAHAGAGVERYHWQLLDNGGSVVRSRNSTSSVWTLSGHSLSVGAYTIRARVSNAVHTSGWRAATTFVIPPSHPACGCQPGDRSC